MCHIHSTADLEVGAIGEAECTTSDQPPIVVDAPFPTLHRCAEHGWSVLRTPAQPPIGVDPPCHPPGVYWARPLQPPNLI